MSLPPDTAVHLRRAMELLGRIDGIANAMIFPTTYGPSAAYVELDARSLDDPSKTWREVLVGLPVTLVRDANGKPREVARLTPPQREREDKSGPPDDSLEREIAGLTEQRLRDAIRASIVAGNWKREEFWKAFTRIVIGWWDEAPLAPVECARHGLASAETLDALKAASDAMTDAERLALMVDLVTDGLRIMVSRPSPDTDALLGALAVDRRANARDVARAVKASRRTGAKAAT